MKKNITLLVFSIIISSCQSKKEAPSLDVSTSSKFNKLTSLVDYFTEDIIEKNNASSFALAIYKNGESYHNYYGKINKGANTTSNDSSLYEIASITKTFTGALVAKAVLEDKINLEDDIRKYLEGDYLNLEFEGHPITIKNLLTHSLGLRQTAPDGFEAMRTKVNNGTYNSKTDTYTIKNLLKELKTVEVDTKPGTAYHYNSIGPELLAYCLEKVNKTSFNKQINAFFSEIGMQNTYLQASEKYKARLVRGYSHDTIAKVDFCPVYGAAGGAISTLPDLALYMKYLIENKKEPWVKEVSRSLFVDKEKDENIGYLWQNIGYAEEEGYFYSKTGTSKGIQSGILICPDSNYGIVLMVNNTSDEAINDWANLFFRDIEPDLIKFPKLNLTSILKKEFKENPVSAFKNFRKFKSDTTNYFFTLKSLNNFGYNLLSNGNKQKAISIFKFAVEEFPKNANAYDSLGEAYFLAEEYDHSLVNYKKALKLNPSSNSAKTYIKKIEHLKI